MSGGESSTRFDTDTYEKATNTLKKNGNETLGLEEQMQIAKAREEAVKKMNDDVIRSRGFAKKGNEELNQSRLGATDALMLGFEDFSKPILTKSPDTNPLTLNQKPANTPPRIPEVGAQGVFPENRANTPAEATPTTPTQTVERPKDTFGVLSTGDKTEQVTQEAKAAQQSIESGNTSPDNMKKVMQSIENGFAILPKGLQNFFKGIMNFIKGLNDNQDTNTALSKLLKNPNEKSILDRFAKSEPGLDGKTGITFNEGAKITKSSKAKPQEGAPVDTTEAKPNKIEGNKITLDKNTTITSVKENIGTVTIVAQNKDGSIDTYTISDTREQNQNTPPTAPSGTKVA